MTSVFISYSHKDEDLREQLDTHLAMLRNEGSIDVWHDRRIAAGDEVDSTIDSHLAKANIILLLVSPDFLASRYCFGVEVTAAMQRHAAKEARVIPVVLRPCDWSNAPFAKLLAAPKDGRPITKWLNRDEAFLDVVHALRNTLPAKRQMQVDPPSLTALTTGVRGPRSSNLGVKKVFTEADKDKFLEEAFEFISLFFENSLREIAERHGEIRSSFRRIDGRTFVAVVYRNGKTEARCRVFLESGNRDGGIAYSRDDSHQGNSFNERLSIESDRSSQFLKSMGIGFGFFEERARDRLSLEGAAEYYWSMFMEPLQR